jgi:hypothetical protein
MNAYLGRMSNSYVRELLRESGNRQMRRPYLRIDHLADASGRVFGFGYVASK